MNKTGWNKKMIQGMIDGIDDEFINEALMYHKNSLRKRDYFKTVVAAACICIMLSGISISVLAAASPEFKKNLNHVLKQIGLDRFVMEETEEIGNKGVKVSVDKNNANGEKTSETMKKAEYYLNLNYIPDGYTCDKNDGSVFYGKDKKVDYLGVAFFHLQEEFINVLSNSREIVQYDTKNSHVYIAKSKWQKRMWIKFTENPYLVEIRDYNNRCSEKELLKMAEGAVLAEKQGKVKYNQLEWTKDLYESYTNYLREFEPIQASSIGS